MKRLLLILAIAASGTLRAQDIVVDAAGGGDFLSIQEAVNSVRDFRPEGRVEIFIKKGVYREKLIIPTNKCAITLRGEQRDSTIVTWGDYASLNKMGTFKTHTVFVGGNDIVFEDLTIENSAGEVGQAVALHIEGDRIVVRRCLLLGNQDTLYAGREGSRQTFIDCYIEGTTDFIFGPATVWFGGCTIHCKKNSYITAASTPQGVRYGFVFDRCRITAAEGVDKVYLGRPWRAYAMTWLLRCELPAAILPAGWDNWGNPANEQTARYGEWRNTGPGAGVAGRVGWSHRLSDAQAAQFDIPRDTSFTVTATLTKERKARPSLELAGFTPNDKRPVVSYPLQVYSTITELPIGIRELHMDIYAPEPIYKSRRSMKPVLSHPAILIVHGGGWNSGSFQMESPIARRLAEAGFVTATVEYRLTPEAPYPAAVYDLKDAVRYLRANAAKYGIDPHRIAIMGFSAGGQLAGLVGATNGRGEYELRRENVMVSSDVQAVINVDGLSDFCRDQIISRAREAREKCLKTPVDALWLGGTYEQRPEVWQAASPLRQVSAASAPVCFINSSIERFHAGRDEQMALMTGLGIHTEVHTLPDTPHTFWMFSQWAGRVDGIVTDFLTKTFRRIT